jgi:hypothetical protein
MQETIRTNVKNIIVTWRGIYTDQGGRNQKLTGDVKPSPGTQVGISEGCLTASRRGLWMLSTDRFFVQ